MTDYSKQVAELVEDAFQHFKAEEDGLECPGVDRAHLQLAAAQTIATLSVAVELRAIGLLLVGSVPVGPSVELCREAFTSAAIHLGLVEEAPEPSSADLFGGQDPADKDVEL